MRAPIRKAGEEVRQGYRTKLGVRKLWLRSRRGKVAGIGVSEAVYKV